MLEMWEDTKWVIEAYLWSLSLMAILFVFSCVRLSLWYKNRTFFCFTYDQLFAITKLKEKNQSASGWVTVCEKTNLIYGPRGRENVLAVRKGDRVRVVAKLQYPHMIYVPNKYSDQFSAFLGSLK